MAPVSELEALLGWWSSRAKVAFPIDTVDDFVFDSGIEGYSLQDWCMSEARGAGWIGIRTIAWVGSERSAAVVFEAEECVTGLRYRFSWLAEFDNRALKRLIETRTILPVRD